MAEPPFEKKKKKKKPGDDGEKETAAERLQASRFRFLNEQLYTTSAAEASAVFDEDRDAFDAYHVGYRRQLEKWPLNPLDSIIRELKKLPRGSVIADMGERAMVMMKTVLSVGGLQVVARRGSLRRSKIGSQSTASI